MLLDADAYREHRTNPNERTVIELSDVRLAIQARVNHSFVQPPPRQVPKIHISNSLVIVLILTPYIDHGGDGKEEKRYSPP